MFRLLLPVLLVAVLGWHPAAFAADQDKNRQGGGNEPPMPGELILPADAQPREDGEKQCMTVCARWGEECILINKGAGGQDRRCRRTCQQFAEECF